MSGITVNDKEILLQELLDIIINAGEAIMDVYQSSFDIIEKKDGSPLTLADRHSNQIINQYLKSKYSIPVLSEENDEIPYSERKLWEYVWIVDPLDGTKEFINKRREFTVNIALVKNGKPILGIIYAPVFKDLFYAVKDKGCFMQYQGIEKKLFSESSILFQNKAFSTDKSHLKIILSRSHNDDFDWTQYIDQNQSVQTISMGSSLKFCRIAQGLVDMNLRMKPTSEWDTAAAQIIMEEAGRNLVKYDDGLPLIYNKKNILNPYFVAY